jgi:uncharacterized protein
MKIASVRQLVLQECHRPGNMLGPSFFSQHLAVVAEYSVKLASSLGANLEVAELASYLHDLSAVRNISTLPQHAIVSAALAREILAERGFSAEVIGPVAQAITTHSSPVQIGHGSLEEVCVSNADAVAQIVRPQYWSYFAFGVRRLSFEEGNRWLAERMRANWAAMIEPAKELARDEYAKFTSQLAADSHSRR